MEEVYSRKKTKTRKIANAETPKKGRNTSAFLDLLLCLSEEATPYSFALKFHKSQAARQKRGGTGEGGESNLTVFHFHKHTRSQS